LKNSWGGRWGEKGYFRMLKDSSGMCGLYNYGYFID
jgi:hypothetical protein